MGGGGSTTSIMYQNPRTGVDRRQYGEKSDGFQSQEEYDAFQQFKKNPKGSNPYGFKYDSRYGTYTLKNGVDAEAAVTDWQNYENERIETATYNAKEDRRKKAPDELGSSKTLDLSIAGVSDKDKKKNPTITQTYDTSPSTASTSQPLGIY